MNTAVKYGAGMLGTMTLAGTMALGMVATGGNAFAATVTCRSTTTHTHTVSSRGTVSDRTTLKKACGRNYDEWSHGWSHSFTGASSTFHLYKDEDYPHFTQVKVTRSVSKTGTVRNTVTYTSG